MLKNNQKFKLLKLENNLKDILKPNPKISTLEWSEKNLYAPSTKALGGKISLWNTPVIAKMVDIFDDPKYEQVWVMGGARCGKSYSTLAHLGKELTTRRRQVLDAWPNDNMIRRFIKNDFNDMIKASPIFKDMLPDDNADRKSGNYKNKIFKNGAKLIEANLQSSNDMSGVDAAIIYAHELDRAPRTTGQDGSVIGQLLARQQAQFIKQAFLEGTPTTEQGLINTGYLSGTQHEAHFKFTCCGEYNPIRWEHKLDDGRKAGVSWSTDNEGHILYETVGYVCPTCGTIHNDDELKKIIYQRGDNELKLVPKFPENPIASVHAGWLLLTPFGTMKGLVHDYDIAMKSGHEMMASFYNLKLGLPYTIPGSKLDFEVIMARSVEAQQLVVPYGYVMLTAGVDVQKSYLAVQIIAWADDEKKQVIYYNHIEGDTSTDEPWDKLFILLDREFDTAYTTNNVKVTMPIETVVCDTGGIDTQYYYTKLRGKQPKYVAIKGSSNFNCPLLRKAKNIDIDYNGKLIEKGIALREIGVSQAKVYLYNQLHMSTNPTDKGYTTFGRFLSPAYFKELCSEQLVVETDSKNNKNIYRFDKVQTRNEALDTYIYAYVAYIITGGHNQEFLDYDKRLSMLTEGTQLNGEREVIKDPNDTKNTVILKTERMMCKMIKGAFVVSEQKFKQAGDYVDLSFEEYLALASVGAVSPHDSEEKIQKVKLYREQQEKANNKTSNIGNVLNTHQNNVNKGSFLI